MASSVLTGKLETDVEVKASADKFHDMFCNRPHHVHHTCSDKVQGCDLHEGEWGTVGSIVCWSYVHGNITNQEIFHALFFFYDLSNSLHLFHFFFFLLTISEYSNSI